MVMFTNMPSVLQWAVEVKRKRREVAIETQMNLKREARTEVIYEKGAKK